MTRIFIENYELDLNQEISHQLTYSIDDIRNLDTKTTSFSKTIIIPGTSNNNKIFGNIFELGNANDSAGGVFYDFDASKAAQARIEINGLQAMKGTMRLLSITTDKGGIEYEVALFGELGGFMTAIGIKKLEDLDFSAYNHNWNETNIVNTFSESRTTTGSVNEYLIVFSPYNSNSVPEFIPYKGSYYIILWGDHFQNIVKNDKIVFSGTDYNDGIEYTIAASFLRPSDFIFPISTVIFINEKPIGENHGQRDPRSISFTTYRTNGYGYTYPLIDYGVSNPTGGYSYPKDWDFRTFRPALFVREYLDKIITNAGYTWESNFLNSKFFKNLIIPNNDQELYKLGESFYLDADAEPVTYTDTISNTRLISFPDITTISGFSSSGSDTIFTYSNSSSTTVKVNVKLKGSLIKTRNKILNFLILLNGDVINNYKFDFGVYEGNIDLNIENIVSIKQNDKIQFVYKISSFFSTSTNILVIDSCNITIVQDPPGFIQYGYDELLNINNLLPKNIYQKDFFISIMKMFNLMVTEKKDINKHLVIEPYIEYYNTERATYQDWSYKVNREKPLQIKPMSEINARIYDFKLKDDSDYYNDEYKKQFNQTYGNRIYDNQLEFAKDTQSVEVIFSPSVLVGFDDEAKIFPAIYKIENDLRTPMAHNIRIMQVKFISDGSEWRIIKDNDTLLYTVPKIYNYAGHLDDPYNPQIDINWGATKKLYFELTQGTLSYNQFNNFYSPYMAEIVNKDSRLVTCEMKLTEKDIFNLDFSKFVMIDGVLFRLMKIYDWSEGALSKVDLLRVINTTYLPDTPATTKSLRMRYVSLNDVDVMLGGSSGDGSHKLVSEWNSFFDLSGGNVFTNCFVDGNDILLIGNVSMDLIGTRTSFDDNSNITGFWDNIKCLNSIEFSVFKNTALKEFYSNGLTRCLDSTFASSDDLYSWEAPNCTLISSSGFEKCYKLRNLDLSSVKQLGDDGDNNNVFYDISGNSITVKINHEFNFDDGDWQYLETNNNLNITLI